MTGQMAVPRNGLSMTAKARKVARIRTACPLRVSDRFGLSVSSYSGEPEQAPSPPFAESGTLVQEYPDPSARCANAMPFVSPFLAQ